jgi:hypothetical protein
MSTETATAHGMIPGSHERLGGAECRCGAEWSVWEEICYVQFKEAEASK